jgi:hypothetical protein
MFVYDMSGRNSAKPGGTAEAKSFCPSNTETEVFLYKKEKKSREEKEENEKNKKSPLPCLFNRGGNAKSLV